MIAYDHSDLGEHVARYLAAMGVVRDFDARQDDAGLPAIFEPHMMDTEAAAVAVRVVDIEQDYHDSNPAVTLNVTIRSAPWDIEGMQDLSGLVWAALHRREEVFELTAGRSVLYSERAQIGATVPDGENRRYARTDTYMMRVQVPRMNSLEEGQKSHG